MTIDFAAGGIDQVYVKPSGKLSCGEIFTWVTGETGFNKSYAIVIGINHYTGGFEPIVTTKKDPFRMRDFLLHDAGFDYVHVLTNEKATYRRIRELMVDDFPKRINQQDRFLFYWSGHGSETKDAEGNAMGYLPLADSKKNRFSSMVSMDDIARWDRLIKAKHTLFILDACFSGLAGIETKSTPRDYTIQQLSKPAHQLITAGTGKEKTIAGDRWNGSIFTDSIIRGAQGEADTTTTFSADGVVNLSELISFVRQRVDFERRAARWNKGITPQPRDLRINQGEFFFVTKERKNKKLESEGKRPGSMEYGLPLEIPVSMGNDEGTADKNMLSKDLEYWEAIKDSSNPNDLQKFIGLYPDSSIVPNARIKLKALQIEENEKKSPLMKPEIEVIRDRLSDGSYGPEMIVVKGGCFKMGSPLTEKDRRENETQHEVCVDDFAIGKYELTIGEYNRFAELTNKEEFKELREYKELTRKLMDQGDWKNLPRYRIVPIEKIDQNVWEGNNYPVVNINWHSAYSIAAWLTGETGKKYRLPSEAEWEYAARGGSTTPYWWGDKIGHNNANCFSCGSQWDNRKPAPVGSFLPNQYGLYDTIGNVWEWTCSNYSNQYKFSKSKKRLSWNTTMVIRGGSWTNQPDKIRAAYRGKMVDNQKNNYVGLRLVREIN